MRGMSTISVGQSRDDIKGMLMHLEDEYRKAIISEKNYADLKEKYSKLLENFDKERKMPKDEKETKMKMQEKRDVKMIIESLDEQFQKGEINKKDYENIKNVNMQRLKELEDGMDENKKEYEIEIKVKSKEKEGAFKKLFGRMRKKKREKGKLEVEVSEDLPAPEEHVEEAAPEDPEKEEVEIDTDKGMLHGMFNKMKGESKIQVDVSEKDPEEIPEVPPETEDGENTNGYDELVNDMFPEKKNTEENTDDVPVEAKNDMPEDDKIEEEKPKKGGFLHSLFGKKKEKAPETNEETGEAKPEENVESKGEEQPKEETEEAPEQEEMPEENKEDDKTEKVEKEEVADNEKVEDVKPEEPKEQNTEKQEAKEAPKDEKPKKSGFFKSMFKKKDGKPAEEKEPKQDDSKKEENQEPKEDKPAEAPKEEAKPEEKNLEPGEIEEVTPEVIEKLAAQMAESSGASAEPVETAPEESGEEEETEAGPSTQKLNIELEKLKVMIDTIRDSKKSSDETIQNISENIGEIRSMVMQSDANFKTAMANMEKMEDEVSDIRPNEISKKFNEIKESMEKDKLEVEKVQKKFEGTNEKVNEIYEMIKSIGGVENLINVNNDIQTKLKDINEAIKYIQRIGAKTEKIFIDMSKSMEDLVMIRAKQEDFDESIKNALTSIDSVNVKLKEYVSKSDLEDIKGEIIMVKKQMDEIKKVLPVAELKLPENMIKLRKDKEDIEMFLESLESQRIEGKINKAEYEEMKKINLKKLDDVERSLEREWKDIDRVMKPDAEEGETEEDAQVSAMKKKKSKRNVKKARKKAKNEKDRKKKILKDLKLNG